MSGFFCILGFGYTAGFVAEGLARQGFTIAGSSRQPELIQHYRAVGYDLVDANAQELQRLLAKTTHLLITAPPVRAQGDPMLAMLAPLLLQYASQLAWVGYLSSTGVYGDYQGAWVDETMIPAPETVHGMLRLKAEEAWQAWATAQNVPLHIFRLSGIYGPDRNALVARLQGKAYSVYKPEQVFSRIHVTDIVEILIASIKRPDAGAIYLLADDEPASPQAVDDFAATLLHLAPLPRVLWTKAPLSPMARAFYQSNRRIKNTKIKEELGVRLRYPNYRSGLQALYEGLIKR